MPEYFGLFLGLAVGVVAGVFGVGGGIVLVPALVYIFKLTQHQAQGTSLAVFVAPIGLLGALRYYYSGNANIHLAAFLAVGLFPPNPGRMSESEPDPEVVGSGENFP